MTVASMGAALAVQYANLEKCLQGRPNNGGIGPCVHLVSKEEGEQNGQHS